MSILSRVLLRFPGAIVYLKCKCRDWQFIYLRPMTAQILVILGWLAARTGRESAAVNCLLTASRFSDGRRFQSTVRAHLHLIGKHSMNLVGPARKLEALNRRCLILAEPQERGSEIIRKGVLLVSFTETSSALFASVDVAALTSRFHVVLEPSWAGYADPAIFCWLNVQHPVLVQASELNDRKLLEALESNLVAVAYGAGDWIDPSEFGLSSGFDKRYDAICVANFGWWKRVHVFLRAVAAATSQIKEYKALLVLATHGRTQRNAKDVEKLVQFFGIENNVTVMVGVPHAELGPLYAASKVCVFPSLKEGSSRVIYESMCSDTPVLVLSTNIGVNKHHINPDTGTLVAESHLARELIRFARNEIHTSPRAWFVAHLGPGNTAKKLEADLDAVFPGEGWAKDGLHTKANSPEAEFVDKNWNPRISEWMSAFARTGKLGAKEA